ncbi:hypothetical protein Q3G72_001546 [Acer saccharum]|nr:hypothetical protein Q3G72_001546 [Acer saccharum]
MASSSSWLHLLFLLCFLWMNLTVKCDIDEEDTLLQDINKYRASLNLTALTKNDNAECLADEIADQFKDQPCTNTTGANTVPGTEQQFADYPNLLAKCHLNISNTQDGIIMPACVPNLVPDLVLSNYTKSQYSKNLNNTNYTGAGIGSDGNWIVVILTTSTPDGSYVPDKSNNAKNDASLLSKIDDDEEDTLLQDINKYRASLNLTALTKNDNAECVADEIADQFKDKPCTNTTGANTVPGTEPQLADYPNLLAKCHLNISNTQDGIVMPACVPNLVPDIVLSNYTKSQYSNHLNNTKYTGAGIGSDGNWIVVILTTSTPEGNYVTDKSNNAENAASLLSKIGLGYNLLFCLIGALLMF